MSSSPPACPTSPPSTTHPGSRIATTEATPTARRSARASRKRAAGVADADGDTSSSLAGPGVSPGLSGRDASAPPSGRDPPPSTPRTWPTAALTTPTAARKTPTTDGSCPGSAGTPCAAASSTTAVEAAKPWKPPSQSGADGSVVVPGTGRKPISPVPPEAPRRSAPSRTTAAPVPWPSHSRTNVSRSRATPSRCSASAARLVSFSTLTPASGSRSWRAATRRRCHSGSPEESRSSPLAGSIRPGAPMPTVCSRSASASFTTRSTSATACSTAGPVPMSPVMGIEASARTRPTRSATATETPSVRTSSAARCARSATMPYTLALGPRRCSPASPTTAISPAAVRRSTRSATVGRDKPVSCFNCPAVSGPSCWSRRRACRSLMARAVLGDAGMPGSFQIGETVGRDPTGNPLIIRQGS